MAANCYTIASKTRKNNEQCNDYMNKINDKNFLNLLQDISNKTSHLNSDQRRLWTEVSRNIKMAERSWDKATGFFKN